MRYPYGGLVAFEVVDRRRAVSSAFVRNRPPSSGQELDLRIDSDAESSAIVRFFDREQLRKPFNTVPSKLLSLEPLADR